MNFTTIILEKKDNIAKVTRNRPKVLNAIKCHKWRHAPGIARGF